MAKYRFKFWFEWGCDETHCPCLWCDDDITGGKFDCYVNIHDLPISDSLKKLLCELGIEHDTALDWSCPSDPSPWTEEQYEDFSARAKQAHKMLQDELGDEYEVIYDIQY